MELILERKIKTPKVTYGNLYVNGKWFAHTCEDAVRSPFGALWRSIFKVKHKTAIPYGIYKVIVSWSPRFRRYLPLVLNVPDFDGIRFHNGINENYSSGCILISKQANKDNTLVNDISATNDLVNLIELSNLKCATLKIVDKHEKTNH